MNGIPPGIRRIGEEGRPPAPWWSSEGESVVAWEADVAHAYVTYHVRETDEGPEVAIVTWWHGSPSLKALFRGGALVEGELLPKVEGGTS